MDVIYQGQKKSLLRWLKGGAGTGETINIRDTVNAVGSKCLTEHFADIAPNYPYFSILLTTASIPQAAQDAIRGIAQPANPNKAGNGRTRCPGTSGWRYTGPWKIIIRQRDY